jgi:ATP-binding cassette subfamily B protein
MNIINHLIYKFIIDNKFKLILLIFISLLINFLKINVISYITANIIKSVNERVIGDTMNLFYYFIIVVIMYISLYNFYEYLQIKILSFIRYWIRNEIMKYILLINNNVYSEINYTKLSAPIYRISNTIFYIFNVFISLLIPNITMIFIILFYFLFKDYNIGIIFLIGNFLTILYFYFISHKIIKYNNIYEKDSIESEFYITEILNNIDKIIFRGEVNTEIDYHTKLCDKVTNSSINFYTESNYYCFIMSIIILITIFIIIYYLIKQYYKKNITSTLFIIFFTILLLYRDLIITTINKVPDIYEFIGKYDSVTELFKNMHYEQNIIDEIFNNKNDKLRPNLKYNKIEFKNVSFRYKEGKNNILTNFNLILDTNNKVIGILGNSGKGKSTFAKLLIKLYKYDGNIYIDGVNIEGIDRKFLRKNILFVNQNSKLFDKKVIQNILYGCDNHDECYEHLNIIIKYPRIFNLFKEIDIHNKMAGSAGENLSGGQRQIVNIINGLITPSKIIILDEPTNGLDNELKKDVIDIILYFKKFKNSIIIITHDNDMSRIFDETIQI